MLIMIKFHLLKPLRLKIKKELTARSDRVKSVDIFPAEVCVLLVSFLIMIKFPCLESVGVSCFV
jgi:hypothetical protein